MPRGQPDPFDAEKPGREAQFSETLMSLKSFFSVVTVVALISGNQHALTDTH